MNEAAEVINLDEQRKARAIRPLKGGNGPTGPTSDNWLAKLELGQRFLCKDLQVGGSELKDCTVAVNLDPAFVSLAISFKGRDGYFEWHDTALFSKQHRLYALLELIDVNSQQVQSGSVEFDEDAEEQSRVHETE